MGYSEQLFAGLYNEIVKDLDIELKISKLV